jgi:hypothetical protein
MKQSRCTGMLFCAALVFFLTSCGGNGSEEKTNKDTTAATKDTTATTVAPPVNTIVTTAENLVTVTHKVSNFAKWLSAYEGHDSARLASGLHNYVIARGLKDTNTVMIVLKADDIAKAKAFSKDPGLKKVMQNGGVIGAPTIDFLVTTWQDTVHLAPGTLRSRTTFTVKDFDVWVKSFQDGKQERMDNGITDRVIGHDADDNKKVALVTAVQDTAKAFAYYKSDALKKRREAGGVIGEPARFLFNIVKRY